ncbi:MAG TPA: FAD-dependent oxidoreductase [Solirubrobacteraceae bacterium]|jgi:glycine/D-amino acid oxidase-like deaminating enzyme
MRTGELGFWWRSLGGPPPPRAPLSGTVEADVAIVGGGYTGLWTAYYLKRAQPSLRIVVLEREVSGFGASGRNGGWVSGFFSGPPRAYERRAGRGSYAPLQRAMFETVDEVGRVLAEEAIDADFIKAGQLGVALNRAQELRHRALIRDGRAHGVEEADLVELSAEQTAARVRVAGACSATFSPHVARVHPAKLVRGLAASVERLGVSIHEHTPVTATAAHRALTPLGAVHARWIVRATEGYTASLAGLRRALVPMNSSMIVTEPLAATSWDAIGWSGSELIADGAHVYVYLQRTEDGRIAIGGRGRPYRFGSRTDGAGETAGATIESLRGHLAEMFPAAAGAAIEHAWSGVLGVPRDWCPAVAADARSGLAWAGGYVGEGLAASNLAGRTLRDLILARDTPLTALAWVGRAPARWEPEPLRWAAIHAVYSLYRSADRSERRHGRPSRLGRLVDSASGRA